MMTNDLGILRCNQPINSRTRITGAQFYQHGDRMHHVAERRRFDQQNTRELRGLQIRLRLVIDLCCCGEAIQFAKTITRRDAFLKRHGGGVRHSVSALSTEWTSSVAKVTKSFTPPSSRPIKHRG